MRSPPPTSPHAQIPSPPPNKVHRVQPGRRRHIKERFSGSIGSDYFQWVCCFRCVDSTNQTMVRIRSRVQSPPSSPTRLDWLSSARRAGITFPRFSAKKPKLVDFCFILSSFVQRKFNLFPPLISSSLQIPSVLMFILQAAATLSFQGNAGGL